MPNTHLTNLNFSPAALDNTLEFFNLVKKEVLKELVKEGHITKEVADDYTYKRLVTMIKPSHLDVTNPKVTPNDILQIVLVKMPNNHPITELLKPENITTGKRAVKV